MGLGLGLGLGLRLRLGSSLHVDEDDDLAVVEVLLEEREEPRLLRLDGEHLGKGRGVGVGG